MGNEEMALVPGVQYGLSSHSNFGRNKSLIFTKLTDSSYRAIQEYLKNRNKINSKPTIQFLHNEGRLEIPSTHGSSNVFNFTLSGNQDIQGSFECVHQAGPTTLESLGSLPVKMRIQANDDVYETTRHRMAVAEENNKNKCTRVIKPNGPDIGRKVKVKGTGRTIPPPSSSYPRHRDYMSIPTSVNSQFRSSTSRPPTSSSNSTSNYSATARSPQEKKVISDLMRRPLKERLIHVLALRPYKKPEIYDRINKEGLREKERPIMSNILRQVAYIRDNTYHLNRHIWNDVQEDWPFYTEQERAMLKRRKPQNLTPPGSSDGSSGSGQSPNSIHAGSPPAITAPPPSLLNKRPGYYQGSDGLPTKKPRVSHYKRPEPVLFVAASDSRVSDNTKSPSGVSATTVGGHRVAERPAGSNSVCAGGNNNNNSGGAADCNNSDSGGIVSNWGSRQQAQRERSNRADYRVERTANSSDVRDAGIGGPAVSANAATSTVISNRPSCLSLTSSPSANERNNHHPSGHGRDSTTTGSARSAASADRRERNERSRGVREERNREKESRNRSSAPSYASSCNESSSNAVACADNTNDNDIAMPFCDLEGTEEYPDYLTYYTTVSSEEQRLRYKDDFQSVYEEYLGLYSSRIEMSRYFKEMYAAYNEYKTAGNEEKAKDMRLQMEREYVYIKSDPQKINEKRRFDYLHEKLTHIKKLVMKYDGTLESDFPAMMGDTATQCGLPVVDASTNTNTGDFDSRHY